MKYLVIKNNDTQKLGAVILQDGKGRIFYTTSTLWYSEVLGVLFARSKFYVESRPDDRTVVKREVGIRDPIYLEVLKTKIAPPYVLYAKGKVDPTVLRTGKEAVERIWKLFSPVEHQEIKEV